MTRVRLSIPQDYSQIKVWDEFWGDRRQEMQRGELYVCEEQETSTVLGYLSLSHGSFLNHPFISGICVLEHERRKGIASLLINHVRLSLQHSRIFTSTEPDNTAANALFKSTGFIEAGTLTHVNFDRSTEKFYVTEDY